MSDITVEDFLSHYGVKGQKWGVVNEDDTSGGNSAAKPTRQDKRNVKAKELEDKSKSYQKQISDLKTARDATTSATEKYKATREINDLASKKDRADSDAKALREGRLTSKQKKIALIAGAAITVVAVKELKNGDARRMVMKGKAFVTGKQIEDLYDKRMGLANPDFNADQIKALVANKINPNHGLPGAQNNCRRCTFAYELRRRGFDVEATLTTNGSGQNAIGLYNALTPDQKNVMSTGKGGSFVNIMKEQIKTAQNDGVETPFMSLTKNALEGGGKNPTGTSFSSLFESLAQQPDRSRGEVGVTWLAGGGHSMAYEIINKVPHIFDTQTGKVYKMGDFMEDLPMPGKTSFTRLDDVPLNMDFLARWVKNV